MEKITSVQNPKIKNLKRLEKAGERKAQNTILIEGVREVVLAQRAGYAIQSIFICPEIIKEQTEYPLAEVQANVSTHIITPQVYQSLTYRETTEGVIALATPKLHTLQNIKLTANPLLLVIEAVEKPGNLGAMLRTSDAAGADAVIICDSKTDLYNPNVIRSSLGTVFTNTIAVCSSSEAIAFVKERNITLYAAELQARQFHYQQNLSKPTAFVVGAESTGLSTAWLTAADQKIKIPMLGKIDSLNVSVSAGILLFEAVRQRANE